MLDNRQCHVFFTTWNYLNLLGAWELTSDKNEWSEQCQFLVICVKCCLTWANCVMQSIPFSSSSFLFYGFDYWLWGDSLADWKKSPELVLTSYFETTSFFLYFSLFNIIINSIQNQENQVLSCEKEKRIGRVWRSSPTRYWSWLLYSASSPCRKHKTVWIGKSWQIFEFKK